MSEKLKEPFSVPPGLEYGELLKLVGIFVDGKFGIEIAGNVGYLTHKGGWNEAEIAELTCEHLEVFLAGAIAYKGMRE